MATAASSLKATPERAAELKESLVEIRQRVEAATPATATRKPILVAVSKYKPASDIQACYDAGQRDFGENYVQELADKAPQLPADIRWHFIGTLQSNKAKVLASIPNLHAVQTVSSAKAATALHKALPPPAERPAPLHVFLQVNTSGEDAKSGLPPPPPADDDAADGSELLALARHVLAECPRLRLQGLMTIGSLAESLGAGTVEGEENGDFARLRAARDALEGALARAGWPRERGAWGAEEGGGLVLSMGMSSDFEAALRAGSDVVRVGTSIFGSRPKKEAKAA
ncbi:uncharacterized protein BXZ73DRAFT_38088 [Epithele typhae]|uniref:uncharacterized protein n=1 Tax=Epithele typhae TaxID=378194 RepID=UPI002008BA32|nr:uncharacterized protein BXZ73DRAFT_38088 [Epithele typhae]KAH9945125.1 hypothetical protein BXZ73DRAFT_38088 [Epithele typhae]